MKKVLYFILLTIMPATGYSLNTLNNNAFSKPSDIPSRFLSSEKTESLQWGCPIAETIEAETSSLAMEKIGQACMDDVRKAAAEKDGVFDVINVSVVWPDVQVSKTTQGFKMEGTIFLETLVMKGQDTK